MSLSPSQELAFLRELNGSAEGLATKLDSISHMFEELNEASAGKCELLPCASLLSSSVTTVPSCHSCSYHSFELARRLPARRGSGRP